MREFPVDTALNYEDFLETDWLALIDVEKKFGIHSLHNSFSVAARAKYDLNEFPTSKALWLLADACGMMLNTNVLNDPYQPEWRMEGKRSAIPEDFSQEHITFFTKILPSVKDNWLRSRLADLVWLIQTPRDPKYAIMAIESYKGLPLDKDSWHIGVHDSLIRAIQLCKMLGKGSGENLKEIENILIKCVLDADVEDSYLKVGIAKVLNTHNLANNFINEFAEILKELGEINENKGIYHTARDCYDEALEWYKKDKSDPEINETSKKIAECFIKEGEHHLKRESPSSMVANSFFEKALHRLRSIPQKFRSELSIDERINDVRKMIESSGKQMLEEMGTISTPPMDISEIVNASIEMVKGKDIKSACLGFSNIHRGAQVDILRESAIELIGSHPFQAILSSTHIASDGRTVAKRAGMDLSSQDSTESNSAIWAQMVNSYQLEVSLVVQGSIVPALRIMHAEHRIREQDFVSIAKNSPAVPVGREYLYGKGLYAGYEYDFVTALHVLTPQIENWIRWLLKQIQVTTTTIDSEGLEHEIGLSSLLEKSEIEGLIGADLLFELKALYTDKFGSNLRNEVAHGLIDGRNSESYYSIYAWWLCFRIVFNTLWNQHEAEKPAQQDE